MAFSAGWTGSAWNDWRSRLRSDPVRSATLQEQILVPQGGGTQELQFLYVEVGWGSLCGDALTGAAEAMKNVQRFQRRQVRTEGEDSQGVRPQEGTDPAGASILGFQLPEL